MDIIWSSKAKITFFKVLDYLNENWTQKEVIQFHQRTQIILNAIKQNPGIFPVSATNKIIRKGIIGKNNSVFYKIDAYHQKILLLTFFDNRQDPKTLLKD